MKTTIELNDAIYRQVKARASLKGQSMKSYFLEALKEKLHNDSKVKEASPGWMDAFGQAAPTDVERVQKIIDEEFNTIRPEDWE